MAPGRDYPPHVVGSPKESPSDFANARFAITKEILEQGRASVEELENAAAEQEKKKGLLKEAVNKRNEALKKLERWVTDFLKVCRIALGRDSQHLEKLGIVVY